MAHGHEHSPLDHVVDHDTVELPWTEIHLPSFDLGPYHFQLTRFMVMEVVAAILIVLVIVPLARHAAKNMYTRGRFMNLFEALVMFIRDGIARPAIGGGHADDHGGHDHGAHGVAETIRIHHEADRFLPYLWTVFFFVLFNNLMGLIPGGASATGNINVTGMLALLTLGAVISAGMRQLGPVGFWVGIVPQLDVPMLLKPLLWGLMFVIEVGGLFIRHIVLAVRLFANMLAGHIVLAVILGFIIQVSGAVFYLVMPASVIGVVLLSLLELFVAFLQAYIFTFLSALFIGAAVHPH
jgi:F-type H+-transporting ATPase subunit a